MVEMKPFGTLLGQDVPLIVLTDGAVSAELIPYGAAVRSLWVPDREGRPTDVVLGYDSLEAYREMDACFGATIGRCANRIGGARFTIDGKTYHVTANEGENTLHGGAEGFHKKLWQYSCGEDSVTFSLDSPDGDEGFPGALHTEVTYTLKDGTLAIDYRAKSEGPTVVNLTNHSYFNLAGHDGGRVDGHVLTILADAYTPAGSGKVPTGAIAPVEGTPLDLRTPTVLGERLAAPFLAATRGYDHNFVLRQGERWSAELWCPDTGIALDLSTTQPGMQLYTAGSLTERSGKDGATYDCAHAVCLEAQHFPDAINHSNFPSPLLRPGEGYHETIRWHFFVK